jgi:putative spermidine/putrescine transport system substrate-binding protein
MLAAPSVIRAQTRKIVVRDLGIGTSFRDAYGKAFAEATGIQVQPVIGANDPLGQIKQMVETKTYTWDMSIVTRQVANQLSQEGADYLEPLKMEDAAGWKAMPETFKSSVYAGNDVVATVLGYRTDTLKTPPRS